MNKKKLILILLILVMAVSVWIAWSIQDPFATPTSVSIEQQKIDPPVKEEMGTGRKILGWILLIATLGCLIGRVWYWRARATPMDWAEIGKQPMMLTVYMLVLFWLIVGFLIPAFWNFMWSDQVLFWSLNVSTIVIVSLISLRNGVLPVPAAQIGARVLLGILVIGIIVQLVSKASWRPPSTDWDKLTLGQKSSGQTELPMQIGLVEATPEWSAEIKNPPLQGVKTVWGRLDTSKGGKCEVMMDKDPKRVFLINQTNNNITPSVWQFRCSEPGAKIKIEVVQK